MSNKDLIRRGDALAIMDQLTKSMAHFAHVEEWRGYKEGVQEYHAALGNLAPIDLDRNEAVQALVAAAREAASALVGPCDTHEGCREALDALRKALDAFDKTARQEKE